MLASITVANVVRRARNELCTFGRAVAQDFEHGGEVSEGMGLAGTRMNGDVVLASLEGSMKCTIERREEALASWDSKACMLALP